MDERDTHFQGFAESLYEKLARNVLSSEKGLSDTRAFKQEQHQIIAHAVSALVLSGCQAISEQQMKQGVRLHPNAMLRAFLDMAEWPAESEE